MFKLKLEAQQGEHTPVSVSALDECQLFVLAEADIETPSMVRMVICEHGSDSDVHYVNPFDPHNKNQGYHTHVNELSYLDNTVEVYKVEVTVNNIELVS